MKLLLVLMLSGAASLLIVFALSGELSGASVALISMIAGLGAFGGAAVWIKAVALREVADSDNKRIVEEKDRL